LQGSSKGNYWVVFEAKPLLVAIGFSRQKVNEMSSSKIENLIQVKQALADKYYSLARIAGSKTKRATYTRQARKYVRQVEDLQRA